MTTDHIMSAASVLLSYALVPQVVRGFCRREGVVSGQTSALTTIGLTIMAVCGFEQGLWWSASVWCVTAALWGCLLWQRVHYSRGQVGE